MRVNLGCGDRYAEGWLNIDLPDMPHRKDMDVDLRKDLPFDLLTITHAYVGHVCEHLEMHEVEFLLVRLLSCMTYQGELMIVGPDVGVAREMLDAGENMWGETLDSLRYGAGRWTGDVHRWEWSSAVQADMVRNSGWVDVQELHINDVSPLWPVADRWPQWQRAVHAKRIAGYS